MSDVAGIVPMWIQGRTGRKRVDLLVMTGEGWVTVGSFPGAEYATLFKDVMLDAVQAVLRGKTVELMLSGLDDAE